jgi:mono/diheme cytochrome c family protein
MGEYPYGRRSGAPNLTETNVGNEETVVFTPGKELLFSAAFVLLAGGLVLGLAGPAAAQSVKMGRDIWLSQVDCSDCHGWAGNGIPDEPRSSVGANLRETVLTPEEIAEVVLCGRPGTAMPHYDNRAYNDDRCYGVTREQLGDATPDRAAVSLVKRHAAALAMFITETFIGAGDVTFEFCAELMGPDSIRCDTLRPGN